MTKYVYIYISNENRYITAILIIKLITNFLNKSINAYHVYMNINNSDNNENSTKEKGPICEMNKVICIYACMNI